MKIVLLMLAAVVPAFGQFEIYLVNGNVEQALPRTFDIGAVEPGGSLIVPFRLRNVSTAPATLDLLTVSGSGFSIANKVALPISLGSQKAVDFSVVFQSSGIGSYSASLDAVGVSVMLTATVPVELTAQLVTAGGVRALSAAPVDFGAVATGASAMAHVVLVNQTNGVLLAPAPVVSGLGFAVSGASPGGKTVASTASVAFDVVFRPIADGAASGVLSLGNRTYSLIGVGAAPVLPHPWISVSLPQTGSAQQGTVSVNLESAAQTTGTGTVSLTFMPAAPMAVTAVDAGIAFASGGQSASFTVSAGDTLGHFGTLAAMAFQTGTTAGTVTVSVQLGGNSDQKAITILPAVVGVTAVQAQRSAGAVEVDLTGFDNTRSAGALGFTFYDGAGKAIGPAVSADGTAGFASYFQASASGTFVLRAVFPVVGDTGVVKAVQAVVTNSAGSATTARVGF